MKHLFFFTLLSCVTLYIYATADSLSINHTPRYELDTIRIVAESPSETAGKPTVIPIYDTNKATEQNLSDLLQNIAGLSISTGGKGESNLQIRGFRKENVKIMIDCRQINGGYFSNVNLAEMPVFDISEVHIIKGAVSPLYGANSSGGVVNFVSRKPDNKSWLTLRASVKRNDTQNLQIITAHQFPLWDYWLSLSGYRTRGFMLSNDFTPTRYEDGGVRNFSKNRSFDFQTKLNWTIWDYHSLGVAFGYTFADERNVPNNIYESHYRKFTDWRRYNISGLGSFQITPELVIKPSVHYDAYDNTLQEFSDREMTRKTLDSTLESWTFSPQLRSEYTFNKDSKLFHLYKYERQVYNRKDDGFYTDWTTNLTHLNNTSLMFTHKFSSKLSSSVSAGASQSSRVFTPYTPNATQETINTALYVEPAFSTHYTSDLYNLSFAISRNIQYPTLHHLYSSSRGNVYLKPEKAKKSEVGIGATILFTNVAIKLENTVFHNQIDGMIDRVGVPRFINQYEIENAGYELVVMARYFNKVETQHQYGYINLNMNKGYDFAEIPAHTLDNTLSVEVFKDLKLSYSVNWSDRMQSPDSDGRLMPLPAKTLHSAGVNYKVDERLRFAFSMTNLFDLDYQEEWGYPAAGRNFSFSVEWVVF